MDTLIDSHHTLTLFAILSHSPTHSLTHSQGSLPNTNTTPKEVNKTFLANTIRGVDSHNRREVHTYTYAYNIVCVYVCVCVCVKCYTEILYMLY
jgi:hypothetical protein